MRAITGAVLAFVFCWVGLGRPFQAAAAEGLRVGVFVVDVSPPLGSPVAYAPARSIQDPLSARGVVILGSGKPIVLCAVDFIGIGNSGYDVWREHLAEAVGTTADRVAVHTLHQHDTPRCDFGAEMLLAQKGHGGEHFDVVYLRRTIARVAAAVHRAAAHTEAVTHLGLGRAKVKKVASNRRILGPDGKVAIIRWSSVTDPAAIAAPEGLIDPYLRTISFWRNDKPLAALTYYATHPQSYYGKGDVTSEFVGIARSQREKALPGVPHIHFNGAGGNIAAGKYNNGTKPVRKILADRMAAGMRLSWEATKKTPISASDVEWRTQDVKLPPAPHLQEKSLLEILENPKSNTKTLLAAASNYMWLKRAHSGRAISLSCLKLGGAYVLHMPGELFVEYQLAAQ